jgi:shikimate dehydrogenase
MIPEVEESPWPAEIPLPKQAFVYDLVYKPPETALIRQAHAAGLAAVNGMGMLIEQAALALERWSGQPVPPGDVASNSCVI